jgi:TonB family protein
MLLLIGGLIFWKLRGSGDPPVATAPPPASTPEIKFEQPPPPPPPPPVEEDAGKKAVGKKFTGPVTGGCAGPCTGDSAMTRAGLSGKAGQARGCYERALRNNNALQGRLTVSVRVGPQGQVCSAAVASNSLGDPGVASCVVQMFRSSSFPPPQGGCMDAQVPMNFVPKGGSK